MEYYCFSCILITKPETRRREAGGQGSRGEQVEGGTAIRMFIQAERNKGWERLMEGKDGLVYSPSAQ